MSRFVTVARLADVPDSGLLEVEIEGRPVVLARVDGQIHALDGICSHAEARLAEGSLYEECLMCPVHGGEFDARTGEAITLPAMEPIGVHEVEVEGDEIRVALRS
ncbi:non-heme iron oxygenase ferredoxin subunit [Myxococcota bacterium]|nr:non-heme iron oxygenase ferredoxin subunit [Myxococcota bacterium]